MRARGKLLPWAGRHGIAIGPPIARRRPPANGHPGRFQHACDLKSDLASRVRTHPLHSIGSSSVHFPCIEIRRAARPPQKGQNGYLAVRPGWRPSGVIAEARNARPSMSDMPWLGPARLPPSRSPRSIRPPRSVRAVERASEANWRFFRRRASAQPVRLSPSQGKPPPWLS